MYVQSYMYCLISYLFILFSLIFRMFLNFFKNFTILFLFFYLFWALHIIPEKNLIVQNSKTLFVATVWRKFLCESLCLSCPATWNFLRSTLMPLTLPSVEYWYKRVIQSPIKAGNRRWSIDARGSSNRLWKPEIGGGREALHCAWARNDCYGALPSHMDALFVVSLVHR